MQIEILYRPSYSVARVLLDRNEKLQVESGAMVGMTPDLKMETEAKGGILKSISRSMFGGESFFMNTYTGSADGDSILLAPPLPGDIAVIEMSGETLMVQSGSYLASSVGITVDTKWSGAKTFFGSEGLIMLRNRRQRYADRIQLRRHPSHGAGSRQEICGGHRASSNL